MDVSGSTVLALAGSIGGNLMSDSSDKAVGQLVILGNFSRPFEVGGNVKVVTGDAGDTVVTQAALIGGNLDVRTGGGADAVTVTNDDDVTDTVPTRVGGNVRLDAGAGNDSVLVDALVAPRAHASVDLGAGDDTFTFGDNGNVDLASLLVDGGAGTDAYVPGAGNVFNFKIRVVNVP
jgi:Ca2+-binding RTX toxin-like protein